jgi:hypothetical protein
MGSRRLFALGVLLAVSALVRAQAPQPSAGSLQLIGYLVPNPLPDGSRPQPAPYRPQAGDILLYDDFNRFHHFLFRLARTSGPTHVAMVINRADGTPAILDLTGPTTITAKVVIIDVETRLSNYNGVIMVRRLREPLTPEQSRDLTHFAETEQGKSFALPRVLLQGTPFCARYGLRRELFGKTLLTRNRWFCSEMVVAGCTSAHILNEKQCCANATVPRDLAFDETYDLSQLYHPPVYWSPGAEK